MRAVWSFWSKPHIDGHALGWATERARLCAWILSVETARRHHPETALYTDDAGARLLVDALALPFDHVHLTLNALDGYASDWWAAGKILTYLQQETPFIHIDSDVFLWKRLPDHLLDAPLLAQNPEYFTPGRSWYYPQKFDLLTQLDGWVPEEVRWYRSTYETQRAFCCGIFGGHRLDFVHHYAKHALDLLLHPANRPLWAFLGGDNILIEQYVLSACVAYHQDNRASPYHNVDVACLFPSDIEAFKVENYTQAGYTHLIGGAKRNPHLCQRLERRLQREYPTAYDRVCALTG